MNQITVYGDSIAAGYGAPPARGFVPVLTRLCSRQMNLPIDYRNYGQSGMTSYALSSALRFNDAWVTGGLTARTVCILIGGDDLIQNVPILLSGQRAAVERALKASAFAYAASLRRIRALTRRPLAVGTIYNPYPATKAADIAVAVYNERVILPAAALVGAAVAPIAETFSGRQAELIDGYGTGVAGAPGRNGVAFPIHPNLQGHAVIAETFLPVVAPAFSRK